MQAKSIRKQQGFGLLTIVSMLIALAFVSLIIIRVFPIYLNHFKVTTHIEEIASNSEANAMTKAEILEAIGKRFLVDRVDYVDLKKDIEITSDAKKKTKTISVKYEAKVDLFYNLSLVAKFDDLTVQVVQN